MIDRVAADLGRRSLRSRSGSSGSCPASSTGRSASAARSPPVRRSCARTAPCGPPTRTGPARAARSEITAVTGNEPGRAVSAARRAVRDLRTPGRCSGDPGPEGRLRAPPRAGHRHELAGEHITARLTTAPGNGAEIGGLKVTTENAWFAVRPSGTEDVYKIYAESFVSAEHLTQVQGGPRRGLGGPRVGAEVQTPQGADPPWGRGPMHTKPPLCQGSARDGPGPAPQAVRRARIPERTQTVSRRAASCAPHPERSCNAEARGGNIGV